MKAKFLSPVRRTAHPHSRCHPQAVVTVDGNARVVHNQVVSVPPLGGLSYGGTRLERNDMGTLADLVAGWIDLPDPTEDETVVLVQRLRDGQRVAAKLKEAMEMLSLELSARLEQDITTFVGVGVVQRGYTRRSQWKDKGASEDLRTDVGNAVSSAIALDVGTGEIDTLRRNIARATVDAMYEIIPAFSGVKAGAKKYGISIGEYRQFSDVPVVTVTPVEDL